MITFPRSSTFLEIKQKIACLVKGIFAREFKDDVELSKTIDIKISSRNLPFIEEKGKAKKQVVCDICGKQHRAG